MTEWLRIGEVSRLTGLTHRTLRHYDELGLLVPSGRSYSDYRLYSPEDMERLLAVQHLKSLGLSLDEVRQVLDDPGTDAAELIGRHIVAVEARIGEEQERLARLQRLRAAAQTGWDDVLDVLSLGEQLQHEDPNVRFRAALTEQGAAAVEDLVERLRSDPEPGVREAATWALVHRGAVVMNAIASLRDGDEQARRSLAHVLGKLRDPVGIATLGELAHDDSEEVAAKAAFGLGQVGGEAAAKLLVPLLSDERGAVREEVTRSLGRIPEAGWLLRDAAVDASAVARLHAIEALAGHADPADVPVLIAALHDADPEVRLAALLALGERPEPEAAAAIREEASSTDDRTRLVARRLLGSS
ncbi:HEAT repeat domain-containing protein [Tessaracoccus sp. ZS01]|uniref:HEAT repeat domain-containing protein n=1 Tax=Tessaracoccus sp. ZS01 TaxID=1906324 RepID=UPI000970109C|nr:HEAT repeat domain-containing protein [Tessaracoccus sp. ZS01]MCG6567752.1 MerR family DNA-binding transcriptional regulator [Tessaracoccus sp. ZS01]OMG55497.1 hypothetical protein BJN44_09015 [Tessaracoccus sp. ZS01]